MRASSHRSKERAQILTRGDSPATPASAALGDESALLAQVAAGERGEAIEQLCARYAKPLYALGMRLLGDRGAAEEMVQDTFVRLWRSAGRFDPGRGSARSFIYTLANRAAIDLYRRSAARPLGGAGALDEASLPDRHFDEDHFDRLVLGMAVREAMTGLSRKHREALELHFREDLTQRQIANRLEVPLGTVKTRTYHALRALRKELEEHGIVG